MNDRKHDGAVIVIFVAFMSLVFFAGWMVGTIRSPPDRVSDRSVVDLVVVEE